MSSDSDNAGIAAELANVIFFKTYLEVYSEQSPRISVYRNGRQQCYIRVDYVATDASGNQVIVDPSQVRLIHYATGTKIPHGSTSGTGDPWYSSFEHWGYTWDRYDMAEAQALQDDVDKVIADDIDVTALVTDLRSTRGRIRSLTSASPWHRWDPVFFAGMVAEQRRCAELAETPLGGSNKVRVARIAARPTHPTRLTRRPHILTRNGREYRAQSTMFRLSTTASEPLGIAAEITAKDVRFTTNDPTVPNDEGMGNGSGQFNSQVIVTPVQVPNYPIDAFGDFLPQQDADYVLKDTYVWWGAVNGHNLRACEQYIHLKVNGVFKKLLSVISPVLTRATLWNDKGDVGAEWSYSYIGDAGSTYLHHPYDIVGFFNSGNNGSTRFTSNTMINAMGGYIRQPRDGMVTVGQLMNNDHLQIADWNGVGSSMHSRNLVVEDELGNRHNLRLYLPEGYYKFNYVAIAKR